MNRSARWLACLAALLLATAALAQDRAAALKAFHQSIARELGASEERAAAIDAKLWSASPPKDAEVARLWSEGRDRDLAAARKIVATPIPAPLVEHESVLSYARQQAANALRARAVKNQALIDGLAGRKSPGQTESPDDYAAQYRKSLGVVAKEVGGEL